MRVDAVAASLVPRRALDERGWSLVLAASALSRELDTRSGGDRHFGVDRADKLCPVSANDPETVLTWRAGVGWVSRVSADDPRAQLFSLYLPLCSATAARPMTLGHLGQSLDGFIATPSGDSQFVTGSDNLVHAHRSEEHTSELQSH